MSGPIDVFVIALIAIFACVVNAVWGHSKSKQKIDSYCSPIATWCGHRHDLPLPSCVLERHRSTSQISIAHLERGTICRSETG